MEIITDIYLIFFVGIFNRSRSVSDLNINMSELWFKSDYAILRVNNLLPSTDIFQYIKS